MALTSFVALKNIRLNLSPTRKPFIRIELPFAAEICHLLGQLVLDSLALYNLNIR